MPLLLLLGSGRPALWGWLHGVVAWLVAVPWILPTLTTYGQLPGWLGGLALLLLAAILGAYDALFAGFGARLWQRGDALSLAGLPALWVALEVARGWLLSGFPWNLAAYAWTEIPGALELASWTGAFGVSALVVAVSLGVAHAVRRRSWVPAAIGLALPALLLPYAARHAGGGVLERAALDAGAPLEAALVQPNTPNRPYFDAAANAADYRRLLAMTAPVCTAGRLVIWPESAAWPRDWQSDPALRADVERLVAAGGCTLLLNSPFTAGARTYNSILLVAPGDAGRPPARADKRHLVPFGEYVPLRRVFPFLGKIARMVGDFAPGERAALLPFGAARLGVAVCYEVIFPGEVAAVVRAGAGALVTVTNDAWYGDTAAPRQHLRAARFRAAENRRWLLRGAITGISAVVRPDGSLAGEIGVGEERTLVTRFAARGDRSPYSRAPWLVPLLAAALALAAWMRDLIAARRTRALPTLTVEAGGRQPG